MGDLVQQFCRPGYTGGYLSEVTGWARITGDSGSFSIVTADCHVYKRHDRNGNIWYQNEEILDYGITPRYFSASMEMKRLATTDRGIFGFAYCKTAYDQSDNYGATTGGLALYGYDDDNTDLYYYAYDPNNGGDFSTFYYLVNLESIDIDPYTYHTYRFMSDLKSEGTYGYYDGVTIDGVGTVCPPHNDYGKLNVQGETEGAIRYSILRGYDTNYTEDAWGGKNLTAYNVTGNNFNKFPKWRKTSAGMRPTY